MQLPETRIEHGPRIAILPSTVADGIAAGEVVDRPAAVVKELVENALDAAATRIDIRVEGAGQRLIEVVDDGEGMGAADLAIAFQRHATSKLRSLDDLRIITTLGFRGEALASIAAVAEIEAVSRPRDGAEGFSIRLKGGSVLSTVAVGSPAGTRMMVEQLFYNTPARLKFLKQPATENAVIHRVVAEFALANPSVAFSLQLDGRNVIQAPGNGDLRATFAALYGPDTAGAMLAIDEGIVHGLISPPALHKGTRDHVVLLVNRRRIQHRNLVFAVEQAYRGLRDPGRFPIAVLNLKVDPAEVDVNVHPTKREVRFHNEGAIFACLERACYHGLRQSPIYELQATDGASLLEVREAAIVSAPSSIEAGAAYGSTSPATEPKPQLPPLTYVGQLLDSYLVAQAPDAAILIDQHAAHERVLFDRILDRLDRRSPSTQPLLIPQLLDLTPVQLIAFEQHEGWLSGLGFEAERFGPQTIRVLAVPSEMPQLRANRVLELLLADLAGERTPDRRLRETAALLACHCAVRFGDRMSPDAAGALLSSLALTKEPISCPHGRPTTLILPADHLRRLFKRP
jgi:DNA mismatch repair protein MutL